MLGFGPTSGFATSGLPDGRFIAPPAATTGPVIVIQSFGQDVSAADQVAICNLALSAVGTRSSISSLSENSAEARQCALHYGQALDRMLRAANWNFARKQVSLALLKDANFPGPSGLPPLPWVYSYAYPSDCIRLRYLMPTFQAGSNSSLIVTAPEWSGPPIRFVVAMDEDQQGNDTQVVLTNQPQALAVYTKRVTNPAFFDATFLEGFYNYLGARLAIALTGDKEMAKTLLQIATAHVQEAKAEDGNEGLVILDSMPDWIRVRGYESDFGFPDAGMGLFGPDALTLIN